MNNTTTQGGPEKKPGLGGFGLATAVLSVSTLVFFGLYASTFREKNNTCSEDTWLAELNSELNTADAWEVSSIGDKEIVRLVAVLFDGFELLDMFGPLEFFSVDVALPVHYEFIFVAETQFIKSRGGVTIHVDHMFSDGPLDEPADLLLLPGANPHHTQNAANNTALIDFLQREGERAGNVMTVCTGAGIFARTGLLTGRNATSNKMLFNWVIQQDPGVNWQYYPRWVTDGKYWTSSGVSAGCDTALAFIADKHGQQVADFVADIAEWSSADRPYVPHPAPTQTPTTV